MLTGGLEDWTCGGFPWCRVHSLRLIYSRWVFAQLRPYGFSFTLPTVSWLIIEGVLESWDEEGLRFSFMLETAVNEIQYPETMFLVLSLEL